ncbi:MAG: hypothetical protein H8D96_08645 [Desulfobacterales bacterium]|uniref:SAP domain-containing protein n=1 Tax=Candidatus Desulfatibia vada TaxID=2841696 RepID=A0A8J6TM02_9BACT|nr:hypothetical protein [Candidatus Desulfatibia vada]MBL6972283.1 hypothetical protein [Desulfobacterales bacterium]
MAAEQNDSLNDNLPDLKHLIRNIQRIENNPDCFGTAEEDCNRPDCVWREYCCKQKT